jgi:hypothetical protein
MRKAVKRRAKLSDAYLAEYERALAWAALPERAETGRRSKVQPETLTAHHSDLA